jgi:hypothetical protein
MATTHESNPAVRRQNKFLESQSAEVISEVSSGLLHRALVQSDDVVHGTIALAASHGNKKIVDGLLSCAREGGIRARMSMCQSLGALATANQDRACDATDSLIRILETDTEWSVRYNAAEALRVGYMYTNVFLSFLRIYIFRFNPTFCRLRPLSLMLSENMQPCAVAGERRVIWTLAQTLIAEVAFDHTHRPI